MNNGIYSLGQTTIDSRALTPVRQNNTIRSVEQILSFPKGNNLFEGYYADDSYVMIIDTTVNNILNVSISLILQTGGFISIDWGDGSSGGLVVGTNMQRNGSFETNFICGGTNPFTVSHNYSTHGIYVVRITGRATGFGSRASLGYNSANITHILSFGNNNGLSICILSSNNNLIYVPPNRPPQHLGNYGDNGGMFVGCVKFNHPNISKWDLNNNTNFSTMFGGCSAFNQSITGVIVNSNTNCFQMFASCSSLRDADFSNWTFSGANDTNSMFNLCTNFLGNGVSSWSTSGINGMTSLFRFCTSFNQELNTWDTSNVTSFANTFQQAWIFNKPLNNWNVRKSTSFFRMFSGAFAFNSSLSGWALGADTSNVNCSYMFDDASSFNQNIGNWDVSKVTNMGFMFARSTVGAYAFNNGGSADINNWNTSNVTNMTYMFANNQTFNQPIGNWNVSTVQAMNNMFQGSTNAFNQDISNWNLAGLNVNTGLDNFMFNKAGAAVYSTANYDALLIGWNNNKLVGANGVANWRTDLRPHFGGAKYTAGGAAATARAALVTYGWTITDGGAA